MKKTRIISTLMAFALIAAPAMNIVPNTTSVGQSHQVIVHAKAQKHGLVKENGNYYYYENGKKVKNASRKANGRWYYFGKDGAALKNWQKINDNWYYFGNDCVMRKGWQEINYNGSKKWFYFDEKGVMQTQWVLDNGTWYFLLPDGTMHTGWLQDAKGNWYYLRPDGGMVTGRQTIDNVEYRFNSDGVMVFDSRSTMVDSGKPGKPASSHYSGCSHTNRTLYDGQYVISYCPRCGMEFGRSYVPRTITNNGSTNPGIPDMRYKE